MVSFCLSYVWNELKLIWLSYLGVSLIGATVALVAALCIKEHRLWQWIWIWTLQILGRRWRLVGVYSCIDTPSIFFFKNFFHFPSSFRMKMKMNEERRKWRSDRKWRRNLEREGTHHVKRTSLEGKEGARHCRTSPNHPAPRPITMAKEEIWESTVTILENVSQAQRYWRYISYWTVPLVLGYG